MSKLACKYSHEYKAVYPPRCNNGDPCTICQMKWTIAENRREFIREIARITNHVEY